MLSALLVCQGCGTKFQADLDRGDTSCPQCGSSNTSSTTDTSGVKKIIK